MAGNVEEIRKHVRVYYIVFAALAVLTVVTVGVTYLHLPIVWAFVLGLTIATVKGSLVACYFMHLISERQIIYSILLLTVFFFAVLMLLPMLTSVHFQVHHGS